MVGCAQQSLAPTKVRPKKYIYIFTITYNCTKQWTSKCFQINFTVDIIHEENVNLCNSYYEKQQLKCKKIDLQKLQHEKEN